RSERPTASCPPRSTKASPTPRLSTRSPWWKRAGRRRSLSTCCTRRTRTATGTSTRAWRKGCRRPSIASRSCCARWPEAGPLLPLVHLQEGQDLGPTSQGGWCHHPVGTGQGLGAGVLRHDRDRRVVQQLEVVRSVAHGQGGARIQAV